VRAYVRVCVCVYVCVFFFYLRLYIYTMKKFDAILISIASNFSRLSLHSANNNPSCNIDRKGNLVKHNYRGTTITRMIRMLIASVMRLNHVASPSLVQPRAYNEKCSRMGDEEMAAYAVAVNTALILKQRSNYGDQNVSKSHYNRDMQ